MGWLNENPLLGFSACCGTFSVNVGFSGRSFEERRCCFSTEMFCSGEIARPMVSGLTLLLENIFGLDVSSLGGTRGGIFAATPFRVPPGILSVGPLKLLYLYFLVFNKWFGSD